MAFRENLTFKIDYIRKSIGIKSGEFGGHSWNDTKPEIDRHRVVDWFFLCYQKLNVTGTLKLLLKKWSKIKKGAQELVEYTVKKFGLIFNQSVVPKKLLL